MLSEENRDDSSVIGDLLQKILGVAAVFQGILAQAQDVLILKTTGTQFAPGAEEFGKIHIGGEACLPQVDIPVVCPENGLIILTAAFQGAGGQAVFGQAGGNITGGADPGGVIGVDKKHHLFGGIGGVLGDRPAAHGINEFQRIEAVFFCHRFVVVNRTGGDGQGGHLTAVVVEPFLDGLPVNGIGQLGTQISVIEVFTPADVTAYIQEYTAVHIPQLVITAIVGIGVGHGIGNHKTHITELEFVTDLGFALGGDQMDKIVADRNPCDLLSPPVVDFVQGGVHAAALEGIGTGAEGMVGSHIGCLYDGDIQKKQEVFIGSGQHEGHTGTIGGQLYLSQIILEPGFVVVVLHGILIAGQNIFGSNGRSVREPGTGLNIACIDHVGGSHLEGGTQDRHRFIAAADGEQRLVHQGKQHTVILAVGDQGVHGPLRIVCQRDRSGFFFHDQILRILTFQQNGIAGRNIGFLFVSGTAGKTAENCAEDQQEGGQFLHLQPSPQTMMAP